jgi:hypothetical protein
MEELSVGGIINAGFSKGFRNVMPIAINAVLWALTIWIPYINVGTTIGLLAGIAAKSSRDEVISYTEIFDPVYRKRMGEFFLVYGLMTLGVWIGAALLIIPGIVVAISWMLAPLLVVDKESNPVEALQRSNVVTYGEKWTIFGGILVLKIIVIAVITVLVVIFGQISGFLAGLVFVALTAVASSVLLCAVGHIYGTLTAGK